MYIRIYLIIIALMFVIKPAYAEPPFRVKARAAVLINAVSGQIVFEQNSEEMIPPASLTKIMTLYLAYDAVDNGHVSLSDVVRISKKAWKTSGSKMFLEVNTSTSLETLLKGIMVVSANDACVAVAEYLAGVEEVFVGKMNKKASAAGMKNTVFKNSHGLPSKGQYVTARDMALLSYHYLRDHPEVLQIHSLKEMTYNHITQNNRNGLLWLDYGVDGLKTGWFSTAGYHIIATAVRNGDRFISVVLGAKSETQRENVALQLLNYAFRNYKTVKIKEEKTLAEISVWYGNTGQLTIGSSHDIHLTLPVDSKGELYVEKDFPERIFAPVLKGQEIGQLRIVNDGKPLKTFPLVALASVEKAGFFKRVFHGVTLFFVLPPYIGTLLVLLFFMIFVFIKMVLLRRKKRKQVL